MSRTDSLSSVLVGWIDEIAGELAGPTWGFRQDQVEIVSSFHIRQTLVLGPFWWDLDYRIKFGRRGRSNEVRPYLEVEIVAGYHSDKRPPSMMVFDDQQGVLEIAYDIAERCDDLQPELA